MCCWNILYIATGSGLTNITFIHLLCPDSACLLYIHPEEVDSSVAATCQVKSPGHLYSLLLLIQLPDCIIMNTWLSSKNDSARHRVVYAPASFGSFMNPLSKSKVLYLSQVVFTLQWSYCENLPVTTFRRLFGYSEGEFNMANPPNLHIFGTVGGNRSTRRKPKQTRGECANSTQTVTQPGIEPGSLALWSGSANDCATMPPYYFTFLLCGFSNDCVFIWTSKRQYMD